MSADFLVRSINIKAKLQRNPASRKTLILRQLRTLSESKQAVIPKVLFLQDLFTLAKTGGGIGVSLYFKSPQVSHESRRQHVSSQTMVGRVIGSSPLRITVRAAGASPLTKGRPIF